MPSPTQEKSVGLTLEAVRGTQETGAIAKYIPVTPDSNFDHKLALINDELLRGDYQEYPPVAGIKETTGKMGTDVDNVNICEILYSLLGKNTITNPTTGVYQHIFRRALISDTNPRQMPSYSVYFRRDIVSAYADAAYVLSVVKSLKLTQAKDATLKAEVDWLACGEETPSPSFTPSFTTNPSPFTFNQLAILLPTSSGARTDIVDFNLTIDNQSQVNRTLNGSQNPKDIITPLKLMVTGGMTIQFENIADRAKFLANTSTDLKLTWTGAQISGAYYKLLELFMRRVHYTDYPFGNNDNLLTAAVTFKSVYSISDTEGLTVTVVNNESGTNYGG